MPGQFLVFYFTARDHIRCDRDGNIGGPAAQTTTAFDSLDAARAFALSEAEHSARIGVGIFNSAGQVIEEHWGESCCRKLARSQSPGRLAFWAGIMLLAGTLFLWWEARSGWTLMFGFLIGARLVFTGVMKSGAALHRWRQERQKVKETPPN